MVILVFFLFGLLAGLIRQAVREYRKFQVVSSGNATMLADLKKAYPGHEVRFTGTHYEVL